MPQPDDVVTFEDKYCIKGYRKDGDNNCPFITCKKCKTCKCKLDDPDDPTSRDCGGDCLKCMAEAGDPDCVEAMAEIHDSIGDKRPFITCKKCHMTSWHPKDVTEEYCGNCHEFHATRRLADGC